MKKILIPTDFSDNAINACTYALNLFGTDQIEYVFLHSFTPPHSGAASLVSINDILLKNAEEDMQLFIYKINKQFPNAISSSFIRMGDLYDVISLYFVSHSAYAAVMGTKGAHGIKGFIFGSNALLALDALKIPTLIIPESIRYRKWDNVVLASDFKGEQPRQLTHLEDLVQLQDAHLTIVHVKEPEYQLASSDYASAIGLVKWFKNVRHDFHTLHSNDVFTALDQYIKSADADLLVLTAVNRPFFKDLFHKSTSKKFAAVSQYPLLILHKDEA